MHDIFSDKTHANYNFSKYLIIPILAKWPRLSIVKV